MKKLTTTRRMGCIPMKTKRRKSPEALFGKVWVVKQSRLMARPLRNELLPACPRPAPIEKIGFFGALGVLTECIGDLSSTEKRKFDPWKTHGVRHQV
jgi:hypothetical protein